MQPCTAACSGKEAEGEACFDACAASRATAWFESLRQQHADSSMRQRCIGLCRCHEHCRAARDRISARSDRDRGTLSLPPSYIRLISPASASAMVRRQGQNELQQVQRGSTSGRLRKSTSMMATPLSKCIHPCKALLCFLSHPAHGWMFRTQAESGALRIIE